RRGYRGSSRAQFGHQPRRGLREARKVLRLRMHQRRPDPERHGTSARVGLQVTSPDPASADEVNLSARTSQSLDIARPDAAGWEKFKHGAAEANSPTDLGTGEHTGDDQRAVPGGSRYGVVAEVRRDDEL